MERIDINGQHSMPYDFVTLLSSLMLPLYLKLTLLFEVNTFMQGIKEKDISMFRLLSSSTCTGCLLTKKTWQPIAGFVHKNSLMETLENSIKS